MFADSRFCRVSANLSVGVGGAAGFVVHSGCVDVHGVGRFGGDWLSFVDVSNLAKQRQGRFFCCGGVEYINDMDASYDA